MIPPRRWPNRRQRGNQRPATPSGAWRKFNRAIRPTKEQRRCLSTVLVGTEAMEIRSATADRFHGSSYQEENEQCVRGYRPWQQGMTATAASYGLNPIPPPPGDVPHQRQRCSAHHHGVAPRALAPAMAGSALPCSGSTHDTWPARCCSHGYPVAGGVALARLDRGGLSQRGLPSRQAAAPASRPRASPSCDPSFRLHNFRRQRSLVCSRQRRGHPKRAAYGAGCGEGRPGAESPSRSGSVARPPMPATRRRSHTTVV